MTKNLKLMFWLCLMATAVLSWAAVWLGGVNQDEGWYLYAANLVNEGAMPYRDFSFTQGPLMPMVYSFFVWVWNEWGLLGARIFTLTIGLVGIGFAVALVRQQAPKERAEEAMMIVFVLLGANLYHLYYLAIPKTYALASLFVVIGFFVLKYSGIAAGLVIAFAAGTRISLGVMLPIIALALIFGKEWKKFIGFTIGGLVGILLVYGPFIADKTALDGLIVAQKYHAARGGSDITWTIGSVSRLVRWYLPVFVVLGLGIGKVWRNSRVMLLAITVVFVVQLAAPFPYEDYQVPIMGILAVLASTGFVATDEWNRKALLVIGMTFACSFGSPLLEKWMTNGQDRFWSIKKEMCELKQLQKAAEWIEQLDPGGKELLTQDLYLAIESGRKVPKGLEMGPFSQLTDVEWKTLLESAPCKVAALSGYTFAIEPPRCQEREMSKQMEYWEILKKHYEYAGKEDAFGQNATTLIYLNRK